MRIRIKRRNFAWLGILAGMVGVAALSGVASGAVVLTLIGIFGVAVAASLLDMAPDQLLDRSRASLTSMRMTPDAREAVERARRRGGFHDAALTLLDVGLITSASDREGVVMRRTRDVSKDDDGVRPYITLHVQPTSAERSARLRFEIIDQNGEQQYVHEMKTYLRDGEMNILADHHLPLFGNNRIPSVGDWDLRVYVDGSLLGAHGFSVTPSLEERYARLEGEPISRSASAAPRHDLSEPADSRRVSGASDTPKPIEPKSSDPMTLEELLRSRGQSGQNGRQ